LKLHKTDIAIQSVVNNINAPTYKAAKLLTQILNDYLELNNQYVINNSTNLAHDIVKLKVNKNHRFITYDIKYLFVNIPIQETLTITDKLIELFVPTNALRQFFHCFLYYKDAL
jgi:hypothetical protein